MVGSVERWSSIADEECEGGVLKNGCFRGGVGVFVLLGGVVLLGDGFCCCVFGGVGVVVLLGGWVLLCCWKGGCCCVVGGVGVVVVLLGG